jgi:hypothetical protein
VILLGLSWTLRSHGERGHGSVVALPCVIRPSQFFPQPAVLVKRCLVCSRWAAHLNVGLVSALATIRDVARSMRVEHGALSQTEVRSQLRSNLSDNPADNSGISDRSPAKN